MTQELQKAIEDYKKSAPFRKTRQEQRHLLCEAGVSFGQQHRAEEAQSTEVFMKLRKSATDNPEGDFRRMIKQCVAKGGNKVQLAHDLGMSMQELDTWLKD
jgi:hypothetical protein